MISAGNSLLHYRVVEKIGEGGMGAVWRATDATLDRDVAIKVLPEDFAKDAERLARFEREAKVLASLNHPNIAQTHGLDKDAPGVQVLVLELVDSVTLAGTNRAAHHLSVRGSLDRQANRPGARRGPRAWYHSGRAPSATEQNAQKNQRMK